MMKRTTKLFMIMLVLVLSAGLTSCDDATGSQDNPVDPTPTPAPIYASDLERPLTFKAAVDGVKVTFKFKYNAKPDYKKVEYSLDQGATWTALKRRSQAITLEKKGDMVMFRGNNPTYNGDARFVTELVNAKTRGFTSANLDDYYSMIFGNGNSLLRMDNFDKLNELLEAYTFKELFKGSNINISDKEKLLLPATSINEGSYMGMFADNKALEVAPELPASTLEEKGYVGMFENCSRLKGVTLGAIYVEKGSKIEDCVQNMLKGAGTLLDQGEIPVLTLVKPGEPESLSERITSDGKGAFSAEEFVAALLASAGDASEPDGNQWKAVAVDKNGVMREITPEKPVDVVNVAGVTLNQEKFSLAVDDTYMLTATIDPENATLKDVSWSSSNTKVATVSSDGLVTALAVGEATITVMTIDGGKTATCTVTVYNANSATIDVTMGEEDL